MNIHQIANELNLLAAETVSLRKLQIVRAGLRGFKMPRTYQIFSKSTVFDVEEAYAFHDGGRSELQFNIGVEYINNVEVFRYGLGLSLYPNHSQPDPINFLTPKILALNDFMKKNKDTFNGLRIWHYDPEGTGLRTEDSTVSDIPADWIKINNFIFLGSYFRKPIEHIAQDDLKIIIDLFDKLFPVYEYVETRYHSFKLSFDGERISRICWNLNGWIKPSGPKGKSTDQSSHESIYGYGHEEWLCDVSKIINGYHYGFLESIRGNEEHNSGKKYNIELFAIDGESGGRYVIGKIEGVEVIDTKEASWVKDEYERRGWIKEMENQIIEVGANASGFSQWPSLNIFNIRFQLQGLHIFDPYLLINDERFRRLNRYELLHKRSNISVEIPVDIPMIFIPDTAKEDEVVEIESISYERTYGPIENLYLHKKIRNALKNHLIDEYGFCVGKECPTGQGTLVDLIREQNGRRIFYEIKAYSSIKSCIREALGQLLEYSLWPDNENAKLMVIVGIMPMTEESRLYMKRLRKMYQIPIYYQQFDIETGKLTGGDLVKDIIDNF